MSDEKECQKCEGHGFILEGDEQHRCWNCAGTGLADPAAEIEQLRKDLATWKETVVDQCNDQDACRKLLAPWDKSESHYVETIPELVTKALADLRTLLEFYEAHAQDELEHSGDSEERLDAAIVAAEDFGALTRAREIKASLDRAGRG